MKRVIPYWERGEDWSVRVPFIKRVESKLPVEATEIPQTSLPCFSFLFLLEGEILADVDGEPFLCRGGQMLMIPANIPFSVHHYSDLVGYTGGFTLSSLRDISYGFLTSGKPIMRTYWFDSAAFIAQIMDRMVAALARGDTGYFYRAFDLFLYSIPSPGEANANPLVNRFFELLFDRSRVLDSVSGYAEQLGISPSYLNKLVRTQTRHSAMDWVEIARVNWAKNLLKESDLSIAEVSKSIGIDDPSYFTRFFHKTTGMTPMEFRRQVVTKPKEKQRSY
jgi:AraC-like DNA-binding protein